jgi:hypothetical protein
MPDEQGRETEKEAEERVAIVRSTQIFGDTPTDPTIGDVTVPAHDEEAANVAAAEVADQVEQGDEDAADLSPEEAKRQLEPLSADDVQEGAEEDGAVQEDKGGSSITAGDQADDGADSTDAEGNSEEEAEESSNEGELSAEEKVERIKSASSPEEVDALAEGDNRVTVQRAADKKRSSWG